MTIELITFIEEGVKGCNIPTAMPQWSKWLQLANVLKHMLEDNKSSANFIFGSHVIALPQELKL